MAEARVVPEGVLVVEQLEEIQVEDHESTDAKVTSDEPENANGEERKNTTAGPPVIHNSKKNSVAPINSPRSIFMLGISTGLWFNTV